MKYLYFVTSDLWEKHSVMPVGSYCAFLMKLLKNVSKISWNKAKSLSFNHILLDLQFTVVVCRSKTPRSAYLSPKFYSALYLGMTERYLCSTQCAFNLIHPHSYKHIFCAFYLTVIHTLVHALESNFGLASCLRLFGTQTGVYRDPKSNIPVSRWP